LELGLRLSHGLSRTTIWIADAHRGDGKRFVMSADEKLAAFLKIQRAISKNSIDIVCPRLARLPPR
jgi:hypothetical protein